MSTDNSCLCAPAKPLMCSIHVSRLLKAIRTLPGSQLPAPTYAQLTQHQRCLHAGRLVSSQHRYQTTLQGA